MLVFPFWARLLPGGQCWRGCWAFHFGLYPCCLLNRLFGVTPRGHRWLGLGREEDEDALTIDYWWLPMTFPPPQNVACPHDMTMNCISMTGAQKFQNPIVYHVWLELLTFAWADTTVSP